MAFISAVPKHIVIALWSGIPCTGGPPLQQLNKHLPGHRAKMAAHRKLWEKLFSNFLILAQAVVIKGGHLIIEWPSRCTYWKDPKVVHLLQNHSIQW